MKTYKYNYCIACRNVDNTTSYHTLPKNPQIREKWLKILNINAERVYNKATICSKHFHISCFSKTALSSSRLIPGSLPNQQPYDLYKRGEHVNFQEKSDASISATAQVSTISSEINLINLQNVMSTENNKLADRSPIKVQNNETIAIKIKENETEINTTEIMLSTSTENNELADPISVKVEENEISEIKIEENEMLEIKVEDLDIKAEENETLEINATEDMLPTSTEINKHADQIPLKVKENETLKRNATEIMLCRPKRACYVDDISEDSRYVGEIIPEHFSTPRTARKSLDLLNLKIKQKNRHIKTLMERHRRLLNKITAFEQLLQHLNEKNMISEDVRDILQANVKDKITT